MMTIKEFAQLCSCNTQTLRYYDRIGLLKPCRVDQWTNYRYYEKEQALDFIKIKHLQSADFSIDEIKTLLAKADHEVYEAFDRKIAEQELKLERIKQIQKSYLEEKSTMEKIMQSAADFMLAQVKDYEGLREFGLDPKDGEVIMQRVRNYLLRGLKKHIPENDVQLTVGDEVYRGAQAVSERLDLLSTADVSKTLLIGDSAVNDAEPFDAEQYETILERHGWEHAYEFIDDLPSLKEPDVDMEFHGTQIRAETNRDHIFRFRLKEVRSANDMSFPMFLFGALLTKQDLADVSVSCEVERSDDGKNHVVLLRRKSNVDITVSE